MNPEKELDKNISEDIHIIRKSITPCVSSSPITIPTSECPNIVHFTRASKTRSECSLSHGKKDGGEDTTEDEYDDVSLDDESIVYHPEATDPKTQEETATEPEEQLEDARLDEMD